jgi:hypothetical protein
MRAFEDRELLADLFHLLHLDESGHPQTHSAEAPVLLVPACIDELLIGSKVGSEEILVELIRWARPREASLDPHALARIAKEIRARYASFRRLEQFRVIPDEDSPELRRLLLDVLPDHALPKGLSARAGATVRRYFTTVLGYSQRTGKAILTRGRNFVRFVRDKVTEIEFPAKADDMVAKKARFGARLFPFKGGKATKWFIVVALGAASFSSPAAGGVALALAFTDP